MTPKHDPFEHHPELRDKITDPLTSFFRTFKPSDFDPRMKEAGLPAHWRLSDEEREATRHEALCGHMDEDLWVFAYGSLMWDPGFLFAEVRKAHVDLYARSFCLKDEMGARGTRGAPGLMAALDSGPGCTGLAFRIEQQLLDEETMILWRREMATGVYIPVVVEAETAHGPVKAVTFAANHNASRIRNDLPREEQVRYIATGAGILGTSLEYIENLADHLIALNIDDAEVFSLLHEARVFRSGRQQQA
ncbi:gamma-glutamylcyclotransferase [Hoeflea prorocentri]|uniref:glutathione-specific gamma-glutamylcyclotransferase n=1 Tax=Hoeflea prorocentri TaxID=1922333 RepID=A0A9X3UJ81_9HYPH|nr:gamma-glutamylcyclotransferase [Hoeflea prorocentri]MCY6381425.1 gamma-glutamylcyclotransferase [Hoeflea prorocentri]MDA5399225.1 gamma-glutamylcyclotransferase [Hoeflea prorocentri]